MKESMKNCVVLGELVNGHFSPLVLVELLPDLLFGLVVQIQEGRRGVRTAAVLRAAEGWNNFN